MEQFLTVAPNIVRCTYAPGGEIRNESCLIDSKYLRGEVCADFYNPVKLVTFAKRDVYHFSTGGEEPVIRVEKTVDGQRTYIENLKQVYDRSAWQAELTLDLWEGEHIFGFGQDEDGVWDLRGHIEYLYQHNMKIPMPMYVSTRGYGVLFDCSCLMVFDDRDGAGKLTLKCVEQVDYYVITGSLDAIIAGYRELTGRASAMPDWVWGYWQSKEKYSNQEELVDVARRHREDGVPLDVVVQDWKTWVGNLWGDKYLDRERYPDMKAASDALHDMNVHSIVSVWPNMNAGGRNHGEFAQHRMLLNDYSTYDAFDSEARKLYWKQAEEDLYSGGFDGWWCDSTEPFPGPDWCGEVKLPEERRFELVGKEHEKYLDPAVANAFALVHAQGSYETQPQKPVVNLTRSGWAGIQKYGAILWAGDTSATWEELRREITKGLRISLSGIPYWTVDAGAFFVGSTECWRRWSGDPDAAPVWFWKGDYNGGIADLGYQELYTRWLQFACFLPIFRSHGTDTPREYWNFAEPFRSVITDTIALRYRLMPYIKEMARRVTEEHFTMLRSLLFDFPGDENAWKIHDQFLFGTDLLVCPVLEPIRYQQNSEAVHKAHPVRSCYLPAGTQWVDFWDRTCYDGGQTIEVPVTLAHIPVFVRSGAVVPMQEVTQYAGAPAVVNPVRF